MGWPTKTNCDTPRPTLGNPRSLVPKIERTSAAAELAFLSLGNYLASPERHPAPVAADRPDTDVITLTDADDLADYLPVTQPASDAVTPPGPTVIPDLTTPCLSPAGTSLFEPDTSVSGSFALPSPPPPTNSRLYLALASPRLKPSRTSFPEPDTSVSGFAAASGCSAHKMIPFPTNGIISGIAPPSMQHGKGGMRPVQTSPPSEMRINPEDPTGKTDYSRT